ncbi:MAG: DUF1018 domain-containing protein [Ruminococcus sp.]|nr:DUF1018 domain-containing protein [Ruminococcus sp.]
MATMTGRLYALASSLGMVERNSKEDAFHQLVYGITGKEHVGELTPAEANAVQHELHERMKMKNHTEPLKKRDKNKKTVPGMMTISQQNLAWRCIYRLAELEPTEASVCDRLLGAIQKILGITASRKDPFRWINFNDGTRLIEQLKRYVRSAERKASRGGSG